MVSSFETFVAIRYLRSRRKELFISISTVLSIIAVALSVMVLNVVMSIMTGFQIELQAKLLNTTAHVVVRRFGGNVEYWKELSEKLRELPEIQSIVPYTYNQGLISTDRGSRGLLIRGVAENTDASLKVEKQLEVQKSITKLFERQPLRVTRPDGSVDEVDLPSIIIGRTLLERMGLRIGDPVTVLTPKLKSTPRGLMPRLRRFVVVGVYSSGLVEFEGGLAYISLEEARKFFDFGEGVTGIELQIAEMFKAKEFAKTVIDHLRALPGGPYYANDWSSQHKALWEALELEKTVYTLVLLLVVMIASFSIVSTLVMMVMEKRKDIAVLKAMGARRRSVLSVFLLMGGVIGGIGTLLGTLLGLAFCIGLDVIGFPIDPTVFSMNQVPVHVSPVNFFIVAISAFVITSLSGIYPAYRAAAVKPVEIFRFS